ncbi:uncharacterized protein KQ657_003748 [Scheffersomyces spartinae]|uniref:Elongation of fatty acids protein n=1 Tax=Scheffersomyces spartinae TaxID=45513 RepID=A0A9P7VC87_9ASCO|nr:uncharacterized protein KQ657_003748 [Scheffersomyces spartinae]KAG7195222.1 hypothetical protein KQ657_003748 [Scheffersomyces spartinae]
MGNVMFGLPSGALLSIPKMDSPIQQSPFESTWLTKIYETSMDLSFPMTIALVYFSFVHFVNPFVVKRQLRKAGLPTDKQLSKKETKKVPAAPFAIAQTNIFKFVVFLHNVFLCVYSVWTFFGFTAALRKTMDVIEWTHTTGGSRFDTFWHTVCDIENGVFADSSKFAYHNLQVYGWWFYMSKFYEVLDTIIILLKGRPSSLLQSYHHAGAMMCMWAGVRFQSPPIWIFVVFNSFIHSLMYFYFSLLCLKIRVPNAFKRSLTSMQIAQFVIGGSLAAFHSFVYLADPDGIMTSCIQTSDQALALFMNVGYLAPLTALFGAFYIESYLKRNTKKA